jgi:hypothetical protein
MGLTVMLLNWTGLSITFGQPERQAACCYGQESIELLGLAATDSLLAELRSSPLGSLTYGYVPHLELGTTNTNCHGPKTVTVNSQYPTTGTSCTRLTLIIECWCWTETICKKCWCRTYPPWAMLTGSAHPYWATLHFTELHFTILSRVVSVITNPRN